MSWMSQLYKTYERNIGKGQQDDVPLTPVAHMNAKAQVEITLSGDGEFLSAAVVDKEDSTTLIPVTEASAGRAGGKVAPHPLCDTLSYIAGDFFEYCDDEKLKKGVKEKFKAFADNLRTWAESEDSHPKVKAIYHYLSKEKTISDLMKAGLIELTAEGKFENKKISGQPYEKVIVRFRVFDGIQEEDCTWKDFSLIESYTKYYLKGQQGKKDICYYTGEERTISTNHPKGVVASDYGAKLVSTNDDRGYTFRGRFQDARQSYALSFEASQKIHSALTWLVKRQGEYVGTQDSRIFVCWNPDGKKPPDPFAELGLFDDEEEDDYTEISYRKQLRKTFRGYQDQFEETDSIIVMGLEAATTGRLSVTYYHEQAAMDFLERIFYWGRTCNWQYLKFNEKKQPYYAVETPIFRRIVECAFGRENGNFIEASDKVLKEHTQRLLKCMLENQPVPYDIVHALAIRASTPMAYTRGNRERVLSTACALISKFYYEKNKQGQGEKEEMKLDLENHDRSYLFGRLLAVCEKVERITYDRGESREPNAIRLQSAFVNHPMQSWKILEGLLIPYFQKLRPGSREYYKGLISSIVTSFRDEDAVALNQELKETYLLGYYLQRAELNKKKEEKEEEQENE